MNVSKLRGIFSELKADMEINPYNFLFHPFHKNHTEQVQTLSIATNLVLATLIRPWYPLLFVAVHAREWQAGETSIPSVDSLADKVSRFFDGMVPRAPSAPSVSPPVEAPNKEFIGLNALKKKVQAHFVILNKLAKDKEWRHLRRPTSHPASDFDAWMFPTDQPSSTKGKRYQLTSRDVEALKNDKNFMAHYRKTIHLVAKSWGWDLKNNQDITDEERRWTPYHHKRLETMLRSLVLFGEKFLHNRLVEFIHLHDIDETLKPEIQPYLKAI